DPHARDAADPAPRLPQDLAVRHHPRLREALRDEEHERGEQHDRDASRVAAADGAIDIERDGLVLALLERMPQPQRTHARVQLGAEALVAAEWLGDARVAAPLQPRWPPLWLWHGREESEPKGLAVAP